jgi:glycosyltransferase involved in cell wall biosynthesis
MSPTPPVRRPRIGIDCHVVNGIHQGSRTHILELVSRLIRYGGDFDLYIFADEPEEVLSFAGIPAPPNVRSVRMKATNPLIRLGLQLPYLAHQHDIDLLHTQYILPIWNVCKAVVTVHDTLFESHPQYFPTFMRSRSRILVRRAVQKQAMHVFTVSNFCKSELMRLYAIPNSKVSVLYNGVDRTRFYPGSNGEEAIRARELQTKSYILCVGRQEPRKNHATLLKAYAMLGSSAPVLVIVGARDFGYGDIPRLISELRLAGRVRILENVGDAELPALYRHARCFVYPSWAEGFGMPVIEAFSSGIPVVCSNTTGLAEIAQGAALSVSPDSAEALCDAIRQCLRGETVLQTQQALRRAKMFDWDRSALLLREKYRELLGGSTNVLLPQEGKDGCSDEGREIRARL